MFFLLDALLHPSLKAGASHDELRRLRLIAGVSACLWLEIVGFGASLSSAMPLASMVSFGSITAAIGAVLVRLRWLGTARGAGPILWVSILVMGFFSGLHEGAHWAFMSPVLGIIVMLAMLIDGPRAAVAAAALASAAVLVMVGVYEAGWQLPPSSPDVDSLAGTGANAVLAVVGLTFLTWLNHSSRQRAYAELAAALERVKESEAARARVEDELRLAQKLEAVGRLAAGVAHEINTPVQFVGSSVEFIGDALGDLSAALEAYRSLETAAAKGRVGAELLAEVRRVCEERDLDYALEETPAAVRLAKDGVTRITKIVRSMREFAHPDAKNPEDVDLNHAVETTLTIAAGEYKHVAELQTSFGELPRVRCMGGEINQVVLNLVVNAAHAIADKHGGKARGRLSVKTWREEGWAVIAVADDGCGIPEAVQPRIFDPFFTTKEVGRGTGQGLAIARSVVVKGHGGTLTFETAPGIGTTFYVRLPLAPPLRLVA